MIFCSSANYLMQRIKIEVMMLLRSAQNKNKSNEIRRIKANLHWLL